MTSILLLHHVQVEGSVTAIRDPIKIKNVVVLVIPKNSTEGDNQKKTFITRMA